MSDVRIELANGQQFYASVLERVSVDHAAYQMESGWHVLKEATLEYFVSEGGIVYPYGSGISVGIAPDIKAQADELEMMYDHDHDEDDD